MKGWVGLVGWPVADGLPTLVVTHQLQVGWLTHISGHPSAAGQAQDRESSPARDRRSTTVPRHQLARNFAKYSLNLNFFHSQTQQ